MPGWVACQLTNFLYKHPVNRVIRRVRPIVTDTRRNGSGDMAEWQLMGLKKKKTSLNFMIIRMNELNRHPKIHTFPKTTRAWESTSPTSPRRMQQRECGFCNKLNNIWYIAQLKRDKYNKQFKIGIVRWFRCWKKRRKIHIKKSTLQRKKTGKLYERNTQNRKNLRIIHPHICRNNYDWMVEIQIKKKYKSQFNPAILNSRHLSFSSALSILIFFLGICLAGTAESFADAQTTHHYIVYDNTFRRIIFDLTPFESSAALSQSSFWRNTSKFFRVIDLPKLRVTVITLIPRSWGLECASDSILPILENNKKKRNLRPDKRNKKHIPLC